MKLGLYGKKLGMTQLFDEANLRQLPVTVVELYDATVLDHRLVDANGYTALVLGFDPIEARKLSKPALGVFTKKNLSPFRQTREIRVADPTTYPCGAVLTVAAFEVGESVHVSGVSKGKGFQGVIKRHGKAGGPAAHGSHFHRSTGSIGQSATPSRVWKNKRMPGHMGNEKRNGKKPAARNLNMV